MRAKRIKLNFLFELTYLRSNLTLTPGGLSSMADPDIQVRRGSGGGGGGGGHPDPEIRRGKPGLQKSFFGPLGLSLL